LKTIEVTDECSELLEELVGAFDGGATYSDVILAMEKTIEILTGQISDFKHRDPKGYASLVNKEAKHVEG